MPSVRVIGPGRAGTALARALRDLPGWDVDGPWGRERDLAGAAAGVDLLVLAVPDRAIAPLAVTVTPVASTVVAHLAGSLGLDVLAPHERRASLHPLVSLPEEEVGARRLAGGATFAIAGDPLVEELAAALGGRAIGVQDADRPAYHAAACIASNHLVALLGQVERIGAAAGVPLDAYLDLARESVENVAVLGPAAALTGPVARGDRETIDRHLAALDPSERSTYRAMASAAERLVRPSARQCRVVARITGLRGELDGARAAGRTVGLVPTMGCLHDGHASLIRRAANECDVVVVTLFVNPLQFGPGEDLNAYPRDFDHDVDVAARSGADLLFAPSVEEMYPEPVQTTVSVAGVSEGMEGASRPSHFTGVATVVAKLFAIAGPCRAYFGEKDFQQLAVVRRVVSDLSLPVEVVGCPTVRAVDGVALSSRNAYLDREERAAATCLHRALQAGAAALEAGERDPAVVSRAMAAVVDAEPLATLDYAEVVDAKTLTVPRHLAGELRLLVAARVGKARLIDNRGVST